MKDLTNSYGRLMENKSAVKTRLKEQLEPTRTAQAQNKSTEKSNGSSKKSFQQFHKFQFRRHSHSTKHHKQQQTKSKEIRDASIKPNLNRKI